MNNSKEKDKQVKISADRHKLLKLLSVETGREMKELLHEALDMFFNKVNDRK